MQTIYKIFGIVVALAIFALGTTVVLAQTNNADAMPMAQQSEQMQNHMLMNQGQRGPMQGQMRDDCCGLDAPLLDRTAMRTAMAELLGMSLDELEASLAEGTRMFELMAEANVAADTMRAVMNEVRETAVAAALADGTITQEQADCVLSRTERGPHLNGQHNQGQRNQNHGKMGPRGGNQ